MLAQDLGQAVFNRAPLRDNGRPVGLIRLMLRPAGLFGMALMALLGVLGMKMWREGVFGSFRQEHVKSVQAGDKSWMLGDRRPPPPAEKVIDPFAPLAKSVPRSIDPVTDATEDAPE